MQKPAISLAYDGSHPSHLAVAVPELGRHGLKATFFVEPARLLRNLAGWKSVFAAGHEAGNGSLVGAALPDGSLPSFHLDAVLDDLDEGQKLLAELFPPGPHAVGLPIGLDLCADGPYASRVVSRYPLVRTGRTGVNSLLLGAGPGLMSLPCRGGSSRPCTEAVRNTMANPAWLVLTIPEIGPEGLTEGAHAELLQYLADHAKELEVVPIQSLAGRKRKPLPSRAHLS